MKKVLIIANLFHASPRIPGMAKYLSDFGWEPTIITVPVAKDPRNLLGFPDDFLGKVRIIETPYKGDIFVLWRKVFKFFGFGANKSILSQTKKKFGITSQKSFIDFIFNLYLTIFGYPDGEKKWFKPAFKVASKLLEKENFDAIISSFSPATAHLIANKLKNKYKQNSFAKGKKIPWVAEFRDLWTQNDNYSFPWWRKIFETRLELNTLSTADVLITVSHPLSEKLKKFYKKEKIYVITNGFDPEKVNEPSLELTKKFTITYTGQIYFQKRDPLKIIVALKDLIAEKIIDPNDIDLRFFGSESFFLHKEIEKYKLSSVVKEYDKIPREEVLKKQRESQILLLLKWEDPKEKGVYSGKIFEYLAAKRPILATGGSKDVISELLEETKAGIDALTVEEIKIALKSFYYEYKQKRKVSFNGDIEEINKYSYREVAKKFADVLNQTI